MRKLSFWLAGFLVGSLVFSCNNTNEPMAAEPVKVGTLVFERTDGNDCHQPDTMQFNCLQISLSYPNLESGSDALKKSVTDWTNAFLTGLMAPALEEGASVANSIQSAADSLVKSHADFVREAPGSPMGGNWAAETNHEVLLNNGQYLTLQIEGYSYIGGAHGASPAAVASFDVASGKQLTWNDLVTDTAAFKALLEKQFMEVRSDIFQPEDGSEPFQFDDIFQFVIPANYGLTEQGIFCYFNEYEVGPYAFGSTQLTIPFSMLGTLAKITVPATEETQNANTAETTDAPDADVTTLYQTAGDSLVLPAFEVEVWLSPEAATDLKKRKETIIVAAYFHAYPNDPEEQDKGMDGEIAVADKLIELSGGDRIARFEGLKFHQDLLNQMEDKDVQLLINVYSGRKSTDDNLLACGIVDAKASQIGNHRYRVACPLITESMDNPVPSTIAFALPEDGAKPTTDLPLVVDCSERGEISFAGTPVATVEELKPLLREALLAWRAQGNKTVPEIKTSGCLMGMQGAVRDVYEVLKTEL